MGAADRINDASARPAERLAALKAFADAAVAASPWGDALPGRGLPEESNNHIHTCYSFSPYTPAAAALGAWKAGLSVAGSVDHDSLEGAAEMREACSILGMGSVTGFEIRVFMHGADERGRSATTIDGAATIDSAATIDDAAFFAGRKINNPDSAGIIYITVQGVPAQARAQAREFLAPIRERRRARTAAMALRANEILVGAGLAPFDFERDVVGRSKYAEGGTITERHLLAAMAESLISGFGHGESLTAGLEAKLGLSLKPKVRATLSDSANPYLMYDLLGILKAEFLPSFFIQPTDECVDARTAVEFAKSVGAIPAYAYLGDVGESPTGDKKAEKFEDDFLPELLAELKALGFLAITYMPPRNTIEQLTRLRGLCADYGFMEISGVDINQPRQSFNCPELRLPEFAHLNASTWAMVAHEALASVDPSLGLFAAANPYAGSSLAERIAIYAAAGMEIGRSGKDAAEVAQSLLKGRYER